MKNFSTDPNFDHDDNVVGDGRFCGAGTVNSFETKMVWKQGSVVGDREIVPEIWFQHEPIVQGCIRRGPEAADLRAPGHRSQASNAREIKGT